MNMKNRNYQTKAIVLKQRPMGEANRLLTLYTETSGKISAIARGSRKPGSKLGGNLELLNLVEISLGRGRHLDHINECAVIDRYRYMREDLAKIAHGLYLAELCEVFGEERSSNPELFRLLKDTLGRLNEDNFSDLVLRGFEMRLLLHCGFYPELNECVECRNKLQPKICVFAPSLGGAICSDCESEIGEFKVKLSVPGMKLLRHVQRSNGNKNEVGVIRVPQEISNEIQNVLKMYLEFIMEKKIKSATFLDLVSNRN